MKKNAISNFMPGIEKQVSKCSQLKQIKEFKSKLRKLMQENKILVEDININSQSLDLSNDLINKIEKLTLRRRLKS